MPSSSTSTSPVASSVDASGTAATGAAEGTGPGKSVANVTPVSELIVTQTHGAAANPGATLGEIVRATIAPPNSVCKGLRSGDYLVIEPAAYSQAQTTCQMLHS